MTTCKRCKKRDTCAGLCAAVERLLPKEMTGKDTHREVNMETDALMAAAERRSYSEWDHSEAVSKRPEVDLSRLSSRERRAVSLIMSGLSQREAAARMKLSRITLRTLVGRAIKKLRVAQFAHITEGGTNG